MQSWRQVLVFCYSAGTGQVVAINHHADGTISLNRVSVGGVPSQSGVTVAIQ